VAVTVGMEALGSPRLGGRGSVWRGPQRMRGAGCGMSGFGLAVTVAHGLALLGWVWNGGRGLQGCGHEWRGSVGRSWFGQVRLGRAGEGRAEARRSRFGRDNTGPVGLGGGIGW
jgi:hypothetical protein